MIYIENIHIFSLKIFISKCCSFTILCMYSMYFVSSFPASLPFPSLPSSHPPYKSLPHFLLLLIVLPFYIIPVVGILSEHRFFIKQCAFKVFHSSLVNFFLSLDNILLYRTYSNWIIHPPVEAHLATSKFYQQSIKPL